MTPAQQRLIDEVAARFGPRAAITDRADIGQMKRDELVRLTPPAQLAALRALDPDGEFNPGKLL